MNFLFLDTETTGLTPTNSQIIEIAGVVAKLDTESLKFELIDSFESLVSLRGEMDDKITRITGITKSELETAEPIHKVQEKWYEFLSKYDELTIVGHSIGFDKGFIENESWYLPNNKQYIDTLDLAKITYPYFNAVNLEFLVENLDLKPKNNQLEVLGVDGSILNAHRAFYDTVCCYNLFEKVLTDLADLGLDQRFYTNLKSNFLNLDINFYSKNTENSDTPIKYEDSKNEFQYINIDGSKYKKNTYDKIAGLGQKRFGLEVLDLMDGSFDSKYFLILLQIYTVNELKIRGNKKSMKIHTKNNQEIYFADLVLDIINPENGDQDNRPLRLGPIESIIPNVRYISEKSINFGKLIDLLEIYIDLIRDSGETNNLTKLISKIISSYSFLLLGLQNLYQRGEYSYNHLELETEEIVINRKLTDLESMINDLKNLTLPTQNKIEDKLVDLINNQIDDLWLDGELVISPKKKLTFRYFRNTLYINTRVSGFNLRSYFQKFFDKYSDVEVETYLDPQRFADFLSLVDLEGVINSTKVKYLNGDEATRENMERDIELKNFLDEKIQLGKLNSNVNLILGGQNSTIRDSERVLTKNHNPKDFLLLGESGSLTKILSKMQSGSTGITVVKIGDFGYLSRHIDNVNIGEIWIANPPYFNINGYWFGVSKRSNNSNFMTELKNQYLDYQCGFIYNKTGKVVYYLRSYST